MFLRAKKLNRLQRSPFLYLKQFLPFVAVLSAIAALIYLLTSNLLSATSLNCQLDNHPCDPLTEKFLKKYLNHPLYSLKLKPIETDLLAFDPKIASAQISVNYPHTLSVKLSSFTDLLSISLYHQPLATQSATATPSAWTQINSLTHSYLADQPFKSLSLTPTGVIIDDLAGTPPPPPPPPRVYWG